MNFKTIGAIAVSSLVLSGALLRLGAPERAEASADEERGLDDGPSHERRTAQHEEPHACDSAVPPGRTGQRDTPEGRAP